MILTVRGNRQTKWVSEKMIEKVGKKITIGKGGRRRKREISLHIHRPSFITCNTKNGCCNVDDWFTRLLAGVMKPSLSIFPNNNAHLNLTPVDYVSSVCLFHFHFYFTSFINSPLLLLFTTVEYCKDSVE